MTLVDVTVRRERLGDISEDDARAEGVEIVRYDGGDPKYAGQFGFKSYETCPDGSPHPHSVAPYKSAVRSFMSLWDSIYGPGAWNRDQDSEVMVIGFRPVLAAHPALSQQSLTVHLDLAWKKLWADTCWDLFGCGSITEKFCRDAAHLHREIDHG